MTGRKLFAGMAVMALIFAACGGTDTTATTETPPSTAAPTTTVPPTTTTTVPPATTTTASVIDASPDEDERDRYGVLALLVLNATDFSPDEIGIDAFVEMIVLGAQLACLELAEERPLPAIIKGSLGQSPVRFVPVDDWTFGQTTAAFSTALHIVSNGMKLYCPSLPPVLPLDDDEMAEAFVNAWQEFLAEG